MEAKLEHHGLVRLLENGFKILMDAILKPSEEDLQTAMDRYTRWFDGKVAESLGQGVD